MYITALPAHVEMLLGFAMKIADMRSASWVFKARREYFPYFSTTKGLTHFMFWQRTAQSLVPTKPETVLAKVVKEMENQRPTTGTQNVLIHQDNVTVPTNGGQSFNFLMHKSNFCPTRPTVQTSPNMGSGCSLSTLN